MFALPSYQENFGIAVAEAARMGLPLVISNRVNLWPDVRETSAGIVTDCDVGQVAGALTTYLTDDDACRRAGIAARELACRRYTWDRSVGALTALYRRILNQVDGHSDVLPAGARILSRTPTSAGILSRHGTG